MNRGSAISLQFSPDQGMPELFYRFHLNLSDSLPGNMKDLPDFFKGKRERMPNLFKGNSLIIIRKNILLLFV